MGYLAFDRGAVDALARALRRALDDLAAVRIADPAAASDQRQITATADLLAPWEGVLRSIASCGIMEGYRRVDAGARDLDLPAASWARLATAAGMELFTDPLGDGIVDPYLEGVALAGALRDGDLDELLGSDEQIAWLQERLSVVAASPEARRGFLERLGDERLIDVCDRLARRQADLDLDTGLLAGPSPAAERIAAVLGTIGRIVQVRRDDGGRLDLATLTGTMQPIPAAQLIAGMTLAADELVALTYATLERWLSTASLGASVLWNERAPGDVLLPVVANDPLASRLLLERSVDQLGVVFRTSREKWPAEAVVLNGTDPAHVSVSQAGGIVPAVLTYLRDEHDTIPLGYGDPPDYSRAWLGALAGGWLFELTSRRSSWGLTSEEASDALRFALDDEDAMRVLTEHGSAAIEAMAGTLAEGGRTARRALEELSGMLGALNALMAAEQVDDALAARAAWDLSWSVATVVAAGALGALNLPAGVLTAMAAEGAEAGGVSLVDSAKATMEREGWLGAPPNESAVRQDAARWRDDMTALQAAAIVGVTFQALVASGRVPPGTPRPPEPAPAGVAAGECTSEQYLDSLRSWTEARIAEGDLDDGAATVLDLSVSTMLNPGQAAAQCVEVHGAR